MKPKRLQNMAALIPLLILLMQLGYAVHTHSLNSYHDEQDCFHSPSILCTLHQIDTLSADLPQQADFVPTILIQTYTSFTEQIPPPAFILLSQFSSRASPA